MKYRDKKNHNQLVRIGSTSTANTTHMDGIVQLVISLIWSLFSCTRPLADRIKKIIQSFLHLFLFVSYPLSSSHLSVSVRGKLYMNK